jgi:membrane protein DedA with SNARE-associated domain
METLQQIVDLFLHLDDHLETVIRDYGLWTYLLLFVIVFCETGLVVTPILPGDSLLFAVGALAARPDSPLDMWKLTALLWVAAVLGDAANYAFGHYLGPRVFKENRRFLKREYLDRTQRFYDRYGGKTIILARFVPIVRTFAPFLAGVGRHLSVGRLLLRRPPVHPEELRGRGVGDRGDFFATDGRGIRAFACRQETRGGRFGRCSEGGPIGVLVRLKRPRRAETGCSGCSS